MKKVIWIVVVVFILVIFLVVKPIRTKNVIRNIAGDALQEALIVEFMENHDSIFHLLKGPMVLEKNTHYKYKWFYNLEWGDTAAIFIDVFKYPTSFSWRDRFFWPRVTMNYQWGYLSGSKSETIDVLPKKYENNPEVLSGLSLVSNHGTVFDHSRLLIDPERLFYFLKEGYFEVLDKKDVYTIVGFYQTIGDIYVARDNQVDTIKTRAAQITIDEGSGLLIIPYNAPPELWGNVQN